MKRNLLDRWFLVTEYRRGAKCRNPSCDYMGTEWAKEGEDTAHGCCTKCGAIWDTPLTDRDREQMGIAAGSTGGAT